MCIFGYIMFATSAALLYVVFHILRSHKAHGLSCVIEADGFAIVYFCIWPSELEFPLIFEHKIMAPEPNMLA